MQKNGVTDFVSETKSVQNYLDFEKLAHVQQGFDPSWHDPIFNPQYETGRWAIARVFNGGYVSLKPVECLDFLLR